MRVDPNYRLGMVQVYNFGIQRTLPQEIVLNIDYTGAYAGNLDMLRAPNRTSDGLINSRRDSSPTRTRWATSARNALAISAGERMHKGVALQADVHLFALHRRRVVGGRQRRLDCAERPGPGRGREQLQLRRAPQGQRQLRHRAARSDPTAPS